MAVIILCRVSHLRFKLWRCGQWATSTTPRDRCYHSCTMLTRSCSISSLSVTWNHRSTYLELSFSLNANLVAMGNDFQPVSSWETLIWNILMTMAVPYLWSRIRLAQTWSRKFENFYLLLFVGFRRSMILHRIVEAANSWLKAKCFSEDENNKVLSSQFLSLLPLSSLILIP